MIPLLGIDYQHLHQINSILSQCDLCWNLSFAATLQFVTPPNTNAQLSLPDYYSVKVRVDSEHVIDALVDNKEFSIAFDYARVVGAGSDVISVREVMLLWDYHGIPALLILQSDTVCRDKYNLILPFVRV